MTRTELSSPDAAALAMLRNAGIQPTPREIMILADDLTAIADEAVIPRVCSTCREPMGIVGACSSRNHSPRTIGEENAIGVLRERIGGDANLRGYLDTLLVQAVQS